MITRTRTQLVRHQKKITDLHLKCIPHPAYSPDLAPSDYHVFGPLMEALGGYKFSTDDELKEAVHRWLSSQLEEYFFSWNPGISEALAHLH
jgi:histone-lysine N-methyltransferase SETMAR